jgi:AcrR family transcriptional regulator
MAPRRVVREEKQQAIVAAALEVFAERGFSAATIDEIARASGLGKGTIYEYFASKEDLFFAVFRGFVGQLLERARALSARPLPSAADRVRTLILGLVDIDEEARRLFPLTFEFWAASASASPELRARVGRLFRDSYADLGRMLADTIRDGVNGGEFDPSTDVAAIAAVLVGSMDGLWLQAWFDPTLNPARMAGRFLDVVLRGLAAPRPGPDGGSHP